MSYLKGELAVVLGVAGLGLGITYWRRARPELRIDPYNTLPVTFSSAD